MWSIILAGIALTVRTNAIIILTVIGVLALVAIFKKRFSIDKRDFKFWLLLGLFIAVCGIINMGRVLWHYDSLDNHLGTVGGIPFPISHYLFMNFNYIWNHPFADLTRYQSFWDYLVKTSIFGDQRWPSPSSARVLNLLLIAIAFYTALPLTLARQAEWRNIFPHLLNALIPFIYLIWFFLRTNVYYTQDFRYIYPSLVCFVIFYMRSMEIYKSRGLAFMQPVGALLAFSFVTLSVMFFWHNWR